MNHNTQADNLGLHRSATMATLYHQQMLGLINVALSHNKSAIEAAHRRAAELLKVKTAKEAQELVAQHFVSHVNESIGFAVDAYRLGIEANVQLSKLMASQIEDGLVLAQDTLNFHPILGNPISNMAFSIVKNSLGQSHAALNGKHGA